MRINDTKRKLQNGQVALGCWTGLASSRGLRRLAADTGFDWMMIDTEHNPIDRELSASCILSIADGSGGRVAPLARVPDLAQGHVKHMLDSGAYGVLAPLIFTVEEAEAFVRSCRYPPQGVRGVYASAPAAYTFDAPFDDYYRTANEQVLVAVQIETLPALHAAEAIAAVDGVDVLFVGPNDLQAALGLHPKSGSTEPKYLEALRAVVRACNKHGKAPGILAPNAEVGRNMMAEGFTFVGVGNDLSFMLNGAKATLEAVRAG